MTRLDTPKVGAMRDLWSRRSAALRAEPQDASQAKPAAAIARKRNWRGQFVKRLHMTPEGSREWLIWSHYHAGWHCRSSTGGACGYTNDIAQAGLFERGTADSYNDGDRNEAFHISEKLPLIEAAIRQHNEALERLNWAAHIAQSAV